MGKCKGYKKSDCWIAARKTEPLCSNCFLQREKDWFKTFLERIADPLAEPSELLSRLEDLLPCMDRPTFSYETLDSILLSIMKRNNPMLLKTVLETLRSSKQNSILLHRIKFHTNNSFCRIYRYLLSSGTFHEPILPEACLHCIGASLTNLSNNVRQKQEILRMFRFANIGPSQKFAHLLRTTVRQYGGEEILTKFVYCVLEQQAYSSTNERIRNLFDSLYEITEKEFSKEGYDAFWKRVYQHPTFLQERIVSKIQDKKQETYDYIWDRFLPVHKELLAVTWDPSRFVAWCLDESMNEFLKNAIPEWNPNVLLEES